MVRTASVLRTGPRWSASSGVVVVSAWIGIGIGAAVSVSIFLTGLLLTGGVPGIVMRRLKQRQDVLEILARHPVIGTQSVARDLTVDQDDDLRLLLKERERAQRWQARSYRFWGSLATPSGTVTWKDWLAFTGAGVWVVASIGAVAAGVLSDGIPPLADTWIAPVLFLAGLPGVVWGAAFAVAVALAAVAQLAYPLMGRYQPRTVREFQATLDAERAKAATAAPAAPAAPAAKLTTGSSGTGEYSRGDATVRFQFVAEPDRPNRVVVTAATGPDEDRTAHLVHETLAMLRQHWSDVSVSLELRSLLDGYAHRERLRQDLTDTRVMAPTRAAEQ